MTDFDRAAQIAARHPLRWRAQHVPVEQRDEQHQSERDRAENPRPAPAPAYGWVRARTALRRAGCRVRGCTHDLPGAIDVPRTAPASLRYLPLPMADELHTQTPLKAELAAARAHTDALFELVAPQTLYQRPVPDRHRLVFYLGHLEAFDWNMLARGVRDEPAFNPAFDQLFEFGIDPAPGAAPADDASDWPGITELHAYNERVRARIDALWDKCPSHMQHVVLEHRWMHAETLCYLLHQLDPALKRGPRVEAPAQSEPTDAEFIDVSAGPARLGQQFGHYGWDNEFPAHTVEVPTFAIGRHKVTNAEYLRFVVDGGEPPPFWRERDGRWWLRRMFDDVPLPGQAPVYATHEQATAYAQWSNAVLPTEAEWHRASGDADYPWGNAAPDAAHGNFGGENWDPVAVTEYAAGATRSGVEQLVGNGWEWTATPFAGFEGFASRDYYPGYSANFFDGKHFVLKGGSPRTAQRLLRRSFRNWFRAGYPYAYTAFRLARR
jgi:gamma-glutamyl hercynylcysteine S-oxide synthase